MQRSPLTLSLLLPAILSLGAADPPDLIERVKAPYVPTPSTVVERMLEMANVTADDVLYDLGSGDGRIVIAAAKRGARAVGIEISEKLVKISRELAEEAGVSDRVEFRTADLFDVDLSEATVVTIYLLPELNLQLRPKLFEDLAAGTRVLSHAFDMWDWKAEKSEVVEHEERGHTVYKWIMPARLEGTWRWRGVWRGRRERTHVLMLWQTFQRVRGSLDIDRRHRPIRDARLRGTSFSFTIEGPDGADLHFRGTVEGNRMRGRLGEKEIEATLTPPGSGN